MGFLATLLLAIIFATLGLLRPRVAFYLMLALIVLFDELGPGFTTYRGSWVFNGYFVGFFGLRLIEVLVAATYIPFILSCKDRTAGTEPFGMERAVLPVFVLWVVVLVAMEFYFARKIEPGNWRLIVTGIMLFHMLMLLFNTDDLRRQLIRSFLILLTVKCIYGLGMWAAGMGTMSPRGVLPFFWDSRQIEAFALGAVILTAYLLNFHAIDPKQRIIPGFWAFVMWCILVAAVAGSIRRTVWVSAAVAMLAMLVLSRRTTILHYLAVVALVASAVGAVLLAPGLEGFRSHMGRYVESMNLFDDYQRSRNIENDVHVSNVESYSKMISENPDLIAVGFHGPSAKRYRELMGEYSDDGYRLGMAHNGPIRTLLMFGIVGLLIYFWMYATIIRRTVVTYRHVPDDLLIKHAGLAAGVFVFLDFTSTMAFVPPFYTSSKGLFYTFLELFLVGAAAHLAVRKGAPRAQMPGTAVRRAGAIGAGIRTTSRT